MPEPFGKLNRRVAVVPIPKVTRAKAPPPSGNNTRLYLYLAGGALFLIMAGVAFAL
jgi:hypothetical protein